MKVIEQEIAALKNTINEMWAVAYDEEIFALAQKLVKRC